MTLETPAEKPMRDGADCPSTAEGAADFCAALDEAAQRYEECTLHRRAVDRLCKALDAHAAACRITAMEERPRFRLSNGEIVEPGEIAITTEELVRGVQNFTMQRSREAAKFWLETLLMEFGEDRDTVLQQLSASGHPNATEVLS